MCSLEHEVEYVLVGGLAGVLHGSPAMTNDADIVPSKDDDNLERLADALRALDARIRVPDPPEGIPFDPHPALLRTMLMLNMTTRCGDLDSHLLARALDDYDALRAASIVFELAGVRGPRGGLGRHHPLEGDRRTGEGSRRPSRSCEALQQEIDDQD